MATTLRQSITLTRPQADYLAEEAKRLGITVSDLIRRIIDQHRERPQ
jgi:predicted DNA-binding ribbon-helix-helix protein